VLNSMDPIFFESNSSSDERGTVSFTNDLNLQKAVRTYKVENSQLKTVRAWHGHKVEEKWVNVEQGEFLVCVVNINDFTSPSKDLEIQTYKMSYKDGFLYIPPNFANGAMNLTEDNAIRYYSSSTLEESLNDDFRFESDYWDPWSQYSPNFYE
tara:strand:+ start:6614 stop:7072 length:459 start_codon:yes stop_codon:yes gene_type:complete